MREKSSFAPSPSYSRQPFFLPNSATDTQRPLDASLLIDAIKRGDSENIQALLKQDTELLGDPNSPILMLLTKNKAVRQLLAANMKTQIKSLEYASKTARLTEWDKIFLIIFNLNLAIYYHFRPEYHEQFFTSGNKLLKKYQIYNKVSAWWRELINGCSGEQAHDFAKLGAKIGNTYLKAKEYEEAIGYFENTIKLEQRSNHPDKEAKRCRLMYLVNRLTALYFRGGCKKRQDLPACYQIAIIKNTLASKNNLLMLNLVTDEEDKLSAIQRFIAIYQVILTDLTTLNAMTPIRLKEKENPESLSITLNELTAHIEELLEAIDSIGLANPMLVDKLKVFLSTLNDEVKHFHSIHKPSQSDDLSLSSTDTISLKP